MLLKGNGKYTINQFQWKIEGSYTSVPVFNVRQGNCGLCHGWSYVYISQVHFGNQSQGGKNLKIHGKMHFVF